MWYYDLRDNFFNAVIKFALKHCHLYAHNIYAMFEKISKKELMCMYKDYEAYTEAKRIAKNDKEFFELYKKLRLDG